MTKKIPKKLLHRIISQNDFNINYYKIYKINKNKSIIYRCMFCFKSRIKKDNNVFYKISGHSLNCPIIIKSFLFKTNADSKKVDLKNSYNNLTIAYTENNLEKIIKNKKKYNKKRIEETTDTSTINNKNDDIYINKETNKFTYFSLLKNVFDKSNNLSKYQEEIGFYYINKKKQIGEGRYSKVFLGEDKYQRLNVAILEIDKEDEYNYNIETFILSRIQGLGNFPNLYNIFEDDEHYYLIENLMGPNLHILHKLCNYYFDYYTIINIGIDLITNIKILHDLGYIHRDLKPDNLVHGNLSYENYKRKNEIGIIDFSNSKIMLGADGKIKSSKKKTQCMGNKRFSSTKALYDLDIGKIDDIKSIFYILIYFYNGTLPWAIKKSNGAHLSKIEIIEIRNKIKIKELCAKFPIDFINLTEKVFNMDENREPDYSFILNEFQLIKLKEENKNLKKNHKFCWLALFQNYIDKSVFINKNKKKEIKELFDKYCIKIKEYLKYINTEI